MKNYPHLKVDLSNCDKEPIHIIGRIQTHGFLFVLDAESKRIRQVSHNIENLTGIAAGQYLDMPLAQVFPPEALLVIETALAQGLPVTPFPLFLQGKHYIGFLHEASESLLLELEPTEHHTLSGLTQFHALLANTLKDLSQKETLTELSAGAANHIQQLLDYDRVMIYQFDEDWHGHVVAEKVKAGVHSYYNHHFPASDIPEQARAMLLKKGIRQITNVDSEGVAILPYFHTHTGQPTDVSDTELRNPSEIHLEYLKNMQAGASLSMAIVVKGRLWGLVCCQHESARFIDYYQRQTAWLMTEYYASALLSAKEKQDKKQHQIYLLAEKVLVEQMEQNLNIREGLFSGPVSLLDLSEATGAGLVLDGKVMTLGQCPSETEIQGIVHWASQQEMPSVYSTQEFSKPYPPAFAFKQIASGVMIVELSRHNQEYLLYFKPEIKEVITWAGNPEKSFQLDAQRKIHPRKSFEKWEQQVQGKSAPWSELEAERAYSLVKTVVSIQLKCQAENLRKTNDQLQVALQQLKNSHTQLEDFTRIASHNLSAPLNNIQGLIDIYKRKSTFSTAKLSLDKIDLVSNNMRQTLEELHQILQLAVSGELPRENVDVNQLLEKEKQSLAGQIQENNALIQSDLQTAWIVYPKIYLESIMHNLLSNAIKYRSSERQPIISVKTWEENNQVLLQVQDNGQGIDLAKHGTKLFGLYRTFHRQADSRGLGLYLVKKQVETLGGAIQVESQPGQGTRFRIIFQKMDSTAAGQGSESTGREPARG